MHMKVFGNGQFSRGGAVTQALEHPGPEIRSQRKPGLAQKRLEEGVPGEGLRFWSKGLGFRSQGRFVSSVLFIKNVVLLRWALAHGKECLF